MSSATPIANCDKVTQYRDFLCEDAPLIFGKEIVTCLLIQEIRNQAVTIGGVSHLLKLSVYAPVSTGCIDYKPYLLPIQWVGLV